MAVLKYKDPETGEIKTVGAPVPPYEYSTEDLVAGESELETGKLYIVYE